MATTPADYDGMSVVAVHNALLLGKPEDFAAAATEFETVITNLHDLDTELVAAERLVVAVHDKWTGPSADRFHVVVRQFLRFVGEVHDALKDYPQQMRDGESALRQAQKNVDEIYKAWANATNPDTSFDTKAVKQLKSLATQYSAIITELKHIPSDPKMVKTIAEEEKKKSDPKKDPKKDDPKKDDPKDDSGTKDDKNDQGSSDSGGGGGSGTDPTTPPKDSSGGGSDGGGTGGSGDPGGPIGDGYRTLPNAPKAKDRNGKTGVDVDGDGQPDLGLDGKPLKDAKLVTANGHTGVDVNGDGIPDIGVDGEILPGCPIVQGPDGTIGIDVDGDGKPDIAISGQILPDAPIVTKDGVRGIDVDGDGLPDLGMDRKPLHDAKLITVDGVTGVDVNGDGKPDIGVKGEILKWAPLATSADGITGVDVNGDGKPDIAVTGGITVPLKRGADGIPDPQLPITMPAMTSTTTSLASLSLGGDTVTYVPSDTNPPTVLTSLGPAVAATRMATADTRSVAVTGTGPHTGSSGYAPAPAARDEITGHDITEHDRPRPQRTVTLADDAWTDSRGLTGALGRPADEEDTWEEWPS